MNLQDINITGSYSSWRLPGPLVDNLSFGGIGFKIGYDGAMRPGGYEGHGRLLHDCKSSERMLCKEQERYCIAADDFESILTCIV